MQTNHTHLQSQRKIPKIYYSDILTKLSSLSHQKSDEVENIMGDKIIITYRVGLTGGIPHRLRIFQKKKGSLKKRSLTKSRMSKSRVRTSDSRICSPTL